MTAARRLATYDDLLALPEEVRAEVLAGEVLFAPSTLPEHGCAQAGLLRQIGGPFDADDGRGGPGGWWIIPELDVRFTPHDIVRPDLAGWRRTRLPSPWGTRPIDVVPDWVCEIDSPSTRALDRTHKAALYARHGVGHYWLVDPESRTLEALSLRDGSWVRTAHAEDAIVRIAPFDGVELEVGRLFPPR